MDFGLSFSFVFKDQDWFKKVAILALVTLIPVIGQFVLMGWMAEILRRVAAGDKEPRLPDLDFGKQLGDGFKLFVVALVYSIPLLIIYIPYMIIVAVAGNTGDDTATTMILVSSICVTIFAILFSIAYALLMPAAYARTAVHDSIGAGLKVGEVFKLVKNNFGTYIMAFLGTLIAGVIASLGSIACGIGVLLTVVYSQAIMGHLFGQAYKQSVDKTAPHQPLSYGEPIPPAI